MKLPTARSIKLIVTTPPVVVPKFAPKGFPACAIQVPPVGVPVRVIVVPAQTSLSAPAFGFVVIVTVTFTPTLLQVTAASLTQAT